MLTFQQAFPLVIACTCSHTISLCSHIHHLKCLQCKYHPLPFDAQSCLSTIYFSTMSAMSLQPIPTQKRESVYMWEHTHAHARTYRHTQTHTDTLTHLHTNTQTQRHAYTHARAHTYTQSISLPLELSLPPVTCSVSPH